MELECEVQGGRMLGVALQLACPFYRAHCLPLPVSEATADEFLHASQQTPARRHQMVKIFRPIMAQ